MAILVQCVEGSDLLGRQVTGKIREDLTRMQGKCPDTLLATLPVQCQREERVGRFRLTVGDPFVIRSTHEINVLKIDASDLMASRGHLNDPRRTRSDECRPEATDQTKVPQMIGRELAFMSICIATQRCGHDPRAVDQQGNRSAKADNALAEGVDGIGLHQIHRLDRDTVDTRQRSAGTLQIASGHDHLCTGLRQPFCRHQTDAGVAACDDSELAGQVYVSHDIGCGAVGVEGRIDGGLRRMHGRNPCARIGGFYFSLSCRDEPVQSVRFSIVIIQNAISDPLSDVLAMAGLHAACSVRLKAGGVWALRFRPVNLKFNAVRRGECWLLMQDMLPCHLAAGDCFVVSRRPFILASAPEVEAIDAAEVFSQHGASAVYGAGDDVELLGGSVSLGTTNAAELIDLLPPAVIIRAESGAASSFAWLLDELDREWQSNQVGAFAMCNDLLRLIFVHALRHHITTADAADLSWLGGLRDPAIAAVLGAIHNKPEKPWTLGEMASIACMSRSSFALRFKTHVGLPPVEYATRWRMRVAASRLLTSVDSVASIAASLGFLSDAAFGVAFRRVHGMSPGRFRRPSGTSRVQRNDLPALVEDVGDNDTNLL